MRGNPARVGAEGVGSDGGAASFWTTILGNRDEPSKIRVCGGCASFQSTAKGDASFANEEESTHASTLFDSVPGGCKPGQPCGSSRRIAAGTRAERDVGSLEPRSRRAGESSVPRTGGQKPGEAAARRQGQDHVVREKSSVCGAEDRAARGQGARCFLSRARPGGIYQCGLYRPARRSGELEQHRAVGAQSLDPQRQDLRHSARGLYGRALLQQGCAK